MAAAAATSSAAVISSLGSTSAQRNQAKSLRAPRATVKVSSARSVVVRAQADDSSASRRSVLSVIAATIAAATSPAWAGEPNPISLITAPKNALKDRDEAFDVDLDYSQRFAFGKLSKEETVIRLKDSVATLKDLKPSIESKTWWNVQSVLRTKLGYLRFDLEKLIALQAKDNRKVLLSELDALYKTIEKLDYTVTRVLDTDKALVLYDKVVADVNALVAKVA